MQIIAVREPSKGPGKLHKVRSTQTQRERKILLHYLAKTPLPDGSQYLEVVKGYCKGERRREEGERENPVLLRDGGLFCLQYDNSPLEIRIGCGNAKEPEYPHLNRFSFTDTN